MHYSLLYLFPFFVLKSLASICPPTGPVLPVPNIPKDISLSNITATLQEFVQNSAENGWNSSTTSFSVMATSPNHTFFDYHHTAPLKNASGVDGVGNDTVYRVASVTKIFTVLAVWLEERMSLDDPITKYVKELNGSPWENVTLRLLTSQLAALPRDGYAFDRASNSEELVPLGFPPLPPSDAPECGVAPIAGMQMCSRGVFFESQSEFNLTGQVGDKVAYSDIAYILLGYALEDLTGMSYEEVLHKAITGPLGLQATSTKAFDLQQAILPVDAGAWYEAEFSYFNPTAGLYSTPNDLSKFIRAIYNNELLTRAKTNEWLKPTGYTAQLDNLVGAPWEIFRPTGFTASQRPIDHYAKSGDLPGFSSSHIVLVPEYELGVTFLAAGPDASTVIPLLLDTVQASLIPVLDNLAREQAGVAYTGEYAAEDTNSTNSISLTIDDGPGLKVSNWTNRDVDILTSFAKLLFDSSPEDPVSADVRLYPQGVENRWRVGFTEQKETKDEGTKQGALRGSACMPWFKVDQFHYGKKALDEVIFRMGDEGSVEGLEVPILRTKLDKVR